MDTHLIGPIHEVCNIKKNNIIFLQWYFLYMWLYLWLYFSMYLLNLLLYLFSYFLVLFSINIFLKLRIILLSDFCWYLMKLRDMLSVPLRNRFIDYYMDKWDNKKWTLKNKTTKQTWKNETTKQICCMWPCSCLNPHSFVSCEWLSQRYQRDSQTLRSKINWQRYGLKEKTNRQI